MKYQFRLMYAVPDSDRHIIRHKDCSEDSETDNPWLFNTVEEAIAFRDANDLSDVYEDAHYWLTPDPYFEPNAPKEPTLKYCYIELAE